jgi:fumarylacetoacetate (FAA) hydrolase family protein
MILNIDTLSIYERLKNVDLDDKVAREISQILKDNANQIIEQQKEELATKHDLSAMKSELVKWVAGMLIAQAAIVATLVKLL